MAENKPIQWPEGKEFAFTVFDDTDWGTVANLKPVYDFLDELGLKTTKTVWPTSNPNKKEGSGDTCDDPEYLAWLLELQKKGFEISYHLNSYNPSKREKIIEGLDKFKKLFENDPATMANHDLNTDGIYWGSARLSFPINKLIYNASTKFKKNSIWEGHKPGSPYFWGDICMERIKYVRNFVYREINTLNACSHMPYHDPAKKYVNQWFAASEGSGLKSYNLMVTKENIDKLEREKGACIMYTHFAAGFYKDGKLDETFKRSAEYLAGKNGWFVPVNVLLDYLASQKGIHTLTPLERFSLETNWLLTKLKRGRTS
jgi:hypothetical protein